MENLTVLSTFFWPFIVGHLSVVSIPFSNRKSHLCFNNCLAFNYSAIYLLFQFLCQTEYLAVVSTRFWPCTVASQSVVSIVLSNGKSNRCSALCLPYIVGNLSVVLILFLNGKSNRCFKNFLSLHCRPLIRRFNFFLKWKIKPLSQQDLAMDCGQCIRCFYYFLK